MAKDKKKVKEQSDRPEPRENTQKEQSKRTPLPRLSLTPVVALTGVVLIYFVAQIVAVNILALAGVLQGRSSRQIIDWFNESLVVQGLLLLLIVAVVTLLVKVLLRATNTSWAKIGLGKLKLSHVGVAVIGYGWYFLLFLATTFVVSLFVPHVDLNQQQQLGFDRAATGAALWFIGFCLIVLPAFYEEILMRGVLFTGLRSKLSFPLTLLTVSVVFGAAHLEWGGDSPLNWAAAIDTFVLSAVLVYLRESSKSLWPAIMLHGLKNLVAFTIVFVFKLGGL